jgi:hypothetical protein
MEAVTGVGGDDPGVVADAGAQDRQASGELDALAVAAELAPAPTAGRAPEDACSVRPVTPALAADAVSSGGVAERHGGGQGDEGDECDGERERGHQAACDWSDAAGSGRWPCW